MTTSFCFPLFLFLVQLSPLLSSPLLKLCVVSLFSGSLRERATRSNQRQRRRLLTCCLVPFICDKKISLCVCLSLCLKSRSLSMSMCLHCPLPKDASDGRAHFPQLFLICLSVCVSVLCRMFDRIGFRPLQFASWFSPIMTCAYVCPAAKTSVCWSNNQRKRRKARDTHTHTHTCARKFRAQSHKHKHSNAHTITPRCDSNW